MLKKTLTLIFHHLLFLEYSDLEQFLSCGCTVVVEKLVLEPYCNHVVAAAAAEEGQEDTSVVLDEKPLIET
jgi:hypothetical protein